MSNLLMISETVPNTEKPKRSFKRAIAVMVLATLSLGTLSACVTDQGTKQVVGSVLGAGAGGYAGSKFGKGKGQLAATAAGAVFGGLLGNLWTAPTRFMRSVHNKRQPKPRSAKPSPGRTRKPAITAP